MGFELGVALRLCTHVLYVYTHVLPVDEHVAVLERIKVGTGDEAQRLVQPFVYPEVVERMFFVSHYHKLCLRIPQYL